MSGVGIQWQPSCTHFITVLPTSDAPPTAAYFNDIQYLFLVSDISWAGLKHGIPLLVGPQEKRPISSPSLPSASRAWLTTRAPQQ